MDTMNQDNENQGAAVCMQRAASILGVSTRTMWRMVAAGDSTVLHIRGCTRLPKAQVLRCLNGNRKANSP